MKASLLHRSLLSEPTGPADDLEGLGYTLLEVDSAMAVPSCMQYRSHPIVKSTTVRVCIACTRRAQ